ncbi:MAG: helix-turn-helix domain-containing protein [Patescibacteria group bacterium]|nr:helix-turn-helix domain-containing protein [Patescibacteria group bacterium]
MDQDLLKLLENAGFTEKEARVYLALLELGQGTVTKISQLTELKRSIIYVILEGLIKRGYASELPDKKINSYQAIDPSAILNQLKITAKNFSEMLPIFRSLRNKGRKRPKITYSETKEGIWNIYEEMNRSEKPFFISNYVRLEKCFPGSVEKWIGNVRKGIYRPEARHLIPNDAENKKIAEKFLRLPVEQEIRALEKLNNSRMDFTLYDNKLAITSLEENPFIVVIESEDLVKSMRPIFELAWSKGNILKK